MQGLNYLLFSIYDFFLFSGIISRSLELTETEWL